MSIEQTLYSTLSGNAAVQALVSSGSPLDHRIYPNLAPDGTAVPYITYEMVSYAPYNFLTGAPDRHRKVFQINCIADDYDTAKSVLEAARAALDELGFQQGGGDDYFPNSQRHRCRMDFAFIEGY